MQRSPSRRVGFLYASLITDVRSDAPLLSAPVPPPAAMPFRTRRAAQSVVSAALARPGGVVAGAGAACPFPDTAAAVCAAAAELGGGAARVRSWAVFLSAGCLVLNLAQNRFCARLGRPHRSNGVYYVVDYRARKAYQKCHDPDCRAAGFRSAPVLLSRAAFDERAVLDAMLPTSPLRQLDWAAESAWLESLSAAELATLDAQPVAAGASGRALDDCAWLEALSASEWAELEARALAAR